MKFSFLIFIHIVFLNQVIFAQKKERQYEVNGQVFLKREICSCDSTVKTKGNEIVSYQNLELYVLKILPGKRSSKIINRTVTNSEGKFSMQLPDGLFALVVSAKTQPFKVDDFDNSIYDIDCLRLEHKKNDGTVNVNGKEVKTRDIVIIEYCPCTEPCLLKK